MTVDFERGDAVAVNGEGLSPASLLARLNDLGRTHGIGRLDLVENRFVGMKSRGMYETPGGTILHTAHRAVEQLTLDRGAAHLKAEQIGRAHSELQSLMRISYAVLCLKTKTKSTHITNT